MAITSHSAMNGESLTIQVTGRFDFSCLQDFRAAYEKPGQRPQVYVVDLQETDYLDSSALGMLLALRDFAGGDEANILLQGCNPDVKKILTITRFNELFQVN